MHSGCAASIYNACVKLCKKIRNMSNMHKLMSGDILTLDEVWIAAKLVIIIDRTMAAGLSPLLTASSKVHCNKSF